jgi:histidine triad (HIT) family protein
MDSCLFCKIIAGKIPCAKVYENEHVFAFKDINPQAPVHLLVLPKVHYAHVHEVPAAQESVLQKLMAAVSALVRQEGLDTKGYRLVINSGRESGQSVDHIHVHILSGRTMHWPPG